MPSGTLDFLEEPIRAENAESYAALRGMTECWRAELRPHNVRVFLVNPSEVITDFAASAGLP